MDAATSVVLGLIQINSGADRRKNLLKIEKHVAAAAGKGVQLVMLPETSDYIGEDFAVNGGDIPGELTTFFGGLACKYGVYLHCGSVTERTEKGKPRNTSLLFDPQGRLIGRYSKLHMFDIQVKDGPSYIESEQIMPGDTIALAKTALGTLGFAICYDLRFPELFRLLAKAGAKLILLAANFTHTTGTAHWETLLRARAIENSCFVAACGQTGEKEAFRAYGHSMVIDPWGKVLGRMEEEEGCLVVSIDIKEVENVRRQIPSLENIREDVYSLTCPCVKVYEE